MPKRAIGIVRVSATKGREGESFHSPKTQLDRIKDVCKREGLDLVEHFEELDVSGRRPLERRPGLKQAVAAIEAGRADVIVVAYFDRLVRSVKVQAEVAERVEKAGGDILTLDAGQITNGKAATKLQANMLGAIAQYVSDQTGDKVREAQARAVALGIPPVNQIVPGYQRGPDKRFVPDPELAPVIREMFERRARGESINELRKFLLRNGIKRTYGGVAKMLSRRTYLGEIHHGDLVNLAAHEPIVERATFERVQNLNLPRAHPTKPSDRLLARLGVLRCGSCGSRLVVKPGGDNINADGTRTVYKNYWCRNPDCHQRVAIHAPVVEGVVVEYVRQAIADLEGRGGGVGRVAEARTALERAQRAYAGAVEAFTGLDGPEVAQRLRELREARDAAQRAYDDEMFNASAVLTIRGATDWDLLNREEQRALIKAVVERVEVKRGGRGRDRVEIVGRTL